MKQLYANNADTTLAAPITPSSLSITVVDGSKFPNPGAGQFFLVTLFYPATSAIEIVRVSSRSGNVFTISSILDRGLEGTTAGTFSTGSIISCRVTGGTLSSFSTADQPFGDVSLLGAPSAMFNAGYVCTTVDPSNNPVIVTKRDENSWVVNNFTIIATGTISSNTTTSLSASSIVTPNFSVGKYLVQITSGPVTGNIRVIQTSSGNNITWTEPMSASLAPGATFDILQANSSLFGELALPGPNSDITELNGLTKAITVPQGGTNITSYTVGDILVATGTTTLSKLPDIAVGNVLLSKGTGVAPAYGKVSLTTCVSGTLPVANGGTGSSTASGARVAIGAATAGYNSDITVLANLSRSDAISPTLFFNGFPDTGIYCLTGSTPNLGFTIDGRSTLTLDYSCATLHRIDGAEKGGTITFNRSLDNQAMYTFQVNGVTTSPNMIFTNRNTLATLLTITPTGDLTALGTVTGASDIRLKTDLKQIKFALDKVTRLTGYTFKRKDTGKIETGLLAQEVGEVLPEAVVTYGEENHLAIAYGNLAGLLVEAIKELNDRVTKIEKLLS